MGMKPLCYLCSKEIDKTAAGLNRKLLDPKDSSRFLCLCCLSDFLDVTQEVLREKAEDLKSQGCTAFD